MIVVGVNGVQRHLLATDDMENNDLWIVEHGQTHQQISISKLRVAASSRVWIFFQSIAVAVK
jgi:hypothetical protein